jgi:23S rRNA pseudouridine2605 synthase
MVMIHDPHRTGARPSGQARAPDGARQEAATEATGDRVAKMLARAGVASRREVERLIEAGRVALNGQILTTPAVKVESGDILTVDGAVVTEAEPARLFRYHKPLDLVTSHKDPQGRPTVFEHLPTGLPRLISVGRLDINSEGLLLLTNDGGLARALEMPQTGIVRRYRARARGRVTQERLDTLKNGITVEGVHYGSIEATLDKAKEGPQGANLWITVVLTEGKNREVRRVLEALGLKVNRLIRLSYGPFALGTLMPGEVEEVGPRVIREQLTEHIAAQNLPKGDRPLWKKAATVVAGPRRGAVEIDRPGKPGRSGKPQRRPRAARTGEPAPKKEYKAGWAKPKPKAVIAKAGGPKRKSGAVRKGSGPARPSRQDGPKRG